ncbi:MAG: hypothetical protein ABR557_14485, partial [Pyrinomonadaceae bacterium]
MPEVERPVAVLARIRRQLPARRCSDLPPEHRTGGVQGNHAHAEYGVKFFKQGFSPIRLSAKLHSYHVRPTHPLPRGGTDLIGPDRSLSSGIRDLFVVVIIIIVAAAEHAFRPT